MGLGLGLGSGWGLGLGLGSASGSGSGTGTGSGSGSGLGCGEVCVEACAHRGVAAARLRHGGPRALAAMHPAVGRARGGEGEAWGGRGVERARGGEAARTAYAGRSTLALSELAC